MMHASSITRLNINGVLYDTMPESLELAGRAWMYGDGVFESMRMFSNNIPLWKYHYSRLMTSLAKLSIQMPDALGRSEALLHEIKKVASGNARIRLMVWRKSGGLYKPENNDARFMISSNTSEDDMFPVHETGLSVGLSHRIQVPIDYYSGIKSLSALRYVKAAQEAHERGLDDVLLMNSMNNICESSNSNLLWTKNGAYFTPPVNDGQVNGVFIQFLRDTLLESGISVTEKPCTFAALHDADEILLTNAISGIRWIRQLDGTARDIKNAPSLTDRINNKICLL